MVPSPSRNAPAGSQTVVRSVMMATSFTVQYAIAVNALLGLLLLGPAVALTPLVWQRVTHLPQQALETSDAPGGTTPG